MENRFGLKDLFLFVLIVVLIVVQFLQMKQRDLQQQDMRNLVAKMETQNAQLGNVMRAINGLEAGGIVVGPQATTRGSTEASGRGFADPFQYIKAAQKLPGYSRGDWLVENIPSRVGRLTPLGSAGTYYGAIVRASILEDCAYRDPYTLDVVPMVARLWQVKDNTSEWQTYVDKRKPVPLTEAEVLKEKDAPPDDKPAERKEYVEKRLKEGRRPEDIGSEPDCPPAILVTEQIRPGVTFSDGHPLTADDVVFTFNWLMNPKVDAPRERAYFERVKSVEKTGDLEVVWKFREPYFDVLSQATLQDTGVLPKHFYEKFTPEQFNERPGLVMGSGPYKLKDPESWTPGQRIELVRNEFYWGVPGPWDRIVFYEVESDAVEMTMFKNGEIDIMACEPEQFKLLLNDNQIAAKTNHFNYESPRTGFAYIAWNELRGGKPTWWTDRRVRQAMTMLTDRQAICNQVFLGYAMPITGPFSPHTKQYDDGVPDWPYDPQKGKALLGEAGFKTDEKGLMLAPDGKPFRFKLTYPSKNETYERVILMLKDGYAKAGIVMEPDPLDFPIMMKRINDRDFEAITLAWTGEVESDIYQEFHSSQIKDQGDDFISYANPELDRLIVQARTTIDEQKRMPMWHKAHQIIRDDQPYTFLFTRKRLSFWDKRIENVEVTKLGLNYISDYTMPYPWFVPKAQQKWGK